MDIAKSFRHLSTVAALCAAVFCGCGEKPAPEPISAAEVPKTLDNAFNSASPEARAAAKAAAEALQKDEQSMALEALEALARKTDLTPEQREAAAKAAISVRAGIVDAAAKGDAAAQAYLEEQRARK
jgi:hypothetical protein